jgi:hypothetical protein
MALALLLSEPLSRNVAQLTRSLISFRNDKGMVLGLPIKSK